MKTSCRSDYQKNAGGAAIGTGKGVFPKISKGRCKSFLGVFRRPHYCKNIPNKRSGDDNEHVHYRRLPF